MDLQATSEVISWTVNGISIFLAIIAASLAAKKKQHFIIAMVFLANAFALFILLSPLVAWISSIVCIIISSSKGDVQNIQSTNSKLSTDNKTTIRPGTIIGLILGVGLVAAPFVSYIRQEASLYDPNSQGWLILSGLTGAFMILNNIFVIINRENKPQTIVKPVEAVQPNTVEKSPSKEEPVVKKESESSPNKIRCRYCDKLYSSEYNGCPHCKKR